MSGLDVGDEVKLLLLQRVHDGHITEHSGLYFDEGRRIWFHAVEQAYSTMVEVDRLELIYPPDSGVWRQKDCEPGELVRGVHFGLTDAERTPDSDIHRAGHARVQGAAGEGKSDKLRTPAGGRW